MRTHYERERERDSKNASCSFNLPAAQHNSDGAEGTCTSRESNKSRRRGHLLSVSADNNWLVWLERADRQDEPLLLCCLLVSSFTLRGWISIGAAGESGFEATQPDRLTARFVSSCFSFSFCLLERRLLCLLRCFCVIETRTNMKIHIRFDYLFLQSICLDAAGHPSCGEVVEFACRQICSDRSKSRRRAFRRASAEGRGGGG